MREERTLYPRLAYQAMHNVAATKASAMTYPLMALIRASPKKYHPSDVMPGPVTGRHQPTARGTRMAVMAITVATRN